MIPIGRGSTNNRNVVQCGTVVVINFSTWLKAVIKIIASLLWCSDSAIDYRTRMDNSTKIVCEIPRRFERTSPSNFRTQGSLIHINSRKIFERDLLSSDSVAKSATQKPWVFRDWKEAASFFESLPWCCATITLLFISIYTNLYWVTNWCIMAVSNFELLLLIRNSTYAAQILRGFSYNVWSIFVPKFGTIELFILILDIFTIIHQSPCCYVVTTWNLLR